MLTRWNDLGLGGLERELSTLTDLQHQMDRLFMDFERGWGSGKTHAPLKPQSLGQHGRE